MRNGYFAAIARIPDLKFWMRGTTGGSVDGSNRIASLYDCSGNGIPPAQSTTGYKPLTTRADNLENRVTASTTITNTVRATGAAGVLTENNSASTTHYVQPSAGVGALGIGTRYRFMARVKKKERHVSIRMDASSGFDAGWAHFNLDTGAVTSTTGTVGNATITPDGDYFIISAEETATAAGTAYPALYLASTPGTCYYTGDSTSGAYIDWMCFQEAAADKTYLATSGLAQYRGANGNAVSRFDGTDDHYRVDNISTILAGEDKPHTIFIVPRMNGTNSGLVMLLGGERTAAPDNGELQLRISANKFQAIFVDAAGEPTGRKDNAGAITLGTGVRVLESVFTGTVSNIYVDGVQDGTTDLACNLGAISCNRWQIGASSYNNALGNPFSGCICDLLIFARALTSTERATVRNALLAVYKNTPLSTLLASTTISPALFFDLETTGTNLRFSSLSYDITGLDGNTYLGNGWFDSVKPCEESGSNSSGSMEITIGGADITAISTMLQNFKKSNRATMYLGQVSATTLAGWSRLWVGYFESGEIVEDATAKIVLAFAGQIETLDREREIRYTNAAQQAVFPGDRGFEYVEALQKWSGFWGKVERPTSKKKKKAKR